MAEMSLNIKKGMISVVKEKVPTLDEQLAEHLRIIEEHIIEAVKLFLENKGLERPTGFFEKLCRAQEIITNLYQAELVRARGPLKPGKVRSKGG